MSFSGVRTLAEQHPKLVIFATTFVMAQVLFRWHDVMSWGEAQMQIEASEYYGG